MPPRPRDNPNKVSAQEDAWARAIADGATRPEAERAAELPQGHSTRLIRRAAVMRRVSELQRPYVVSWKRLLVKAQHILDDHLESREEMAAILLNRLESGKQITKVELATFLKQIRISPSDRNSAAKMVLDAMAKINPKSLTDAAGAEDATMGRDEAIQKMLGADAEGEVADTAAPPDPDAEEAEVEEVTH